MQSKEPQIRTGFLPALAASVWHHHPRPGEGIAFLHGTLEPLGLFSVSLDEPLELCLDHFSRVLIELEDLCLRAPWAGPIRKCSTKHT